MHLVVGLGNPGRQYDGTRHNIGFELVDALAERWRYPLTKQAHQALITRGVIRGVDAILCKPQTYMNLSGDAVGSLMRYYKLTPGDVVVVHDELDFAPGEVRLKPNGGHGGHNGLRSLIAHIGAEFTRVRMGVGKPRGDGAAWVLSQFGGHERQLMNEAVLLAAEVVECVLHDGLQTAMNRYNQKPR